MKKRMMGLLLILCLIWTMIPAGAFAATNASCGVWVGGVEVTADNCRDVLGDGTVSYNALTQVLTLNNAAITGTASPEGDVAYGVYAAQDIWLELKGTNRITVNTDGKHTGLRVKGSALISGDGSLTVTTSDCDPAAAGSTSYGISITGELWVESGTLNVTAGNAAADGQCVGIWAAELIQVMDGTLNVTAGTGSISVGIGSEGSYMQMGGTVTTSASDGGISYGLFLYSNDLVVVGSDSRLTATAGQANGLSAGISCYRLTMDGGVVTGESAPSNNNGCSGIDASVIYLSGGLLKGVAHNASSSARSVGVSANYIYVDGGELMGVTDATTAGYAIGVHSSFVSDDLEGSGKIDVLGYGKLTGQCAGSATKENYHAIVAQRGMFISDEHKAEGHQGTFANGNTTLNQMTAGKAVTIANGVAQKYWIYTETDGQGTVSTNVDRAVAGEVVTVTVVPGAGLELDTVTVERLNGKTVTVDGVVHVTFVMPDSDVTVYATFRPERDYYAKGTTGDLSWILTKDGTLTFTGTGAMPDYAGKNQMPWYFCRDAIRKVVLQDGITSVGSYAFYGMELETIELPDSVTRIGDYTFKNCPKLNHVTLPQNLTSLGDSAFYACTALTAIDIPASLWTVKPYTFKNCTALASVTFHEGNLMKISDGAFYGCTALTGIALPGCLDIVDSYSFKNCTKLASVTIPAGDLTEIREAVFYGTALTTLNLPEGITKIGPYAFKNCTALTALQLPSTLTKVGEAAFYGCTALTEVTLPDKVASVDNYAFRKCTELTTVRFGTGLKTIGESAFYGCGKLTALVLPDALTAIGAYAFKACTGLTSVQFGTGLTTIGDSAFHTCTGLKKLTFPASLTTIGAYAFSGSWNLYELTFTGKAPAIGTSAFKSMVAAAYYVPGDSWTSAVMQNYGGRITWKAK